MVTNQLRTLGVVRIIDTIDIDKSLTPNCFNVNDFILWVKV